MRAAPLLLMLAACGDDPTCPVEPAASVDMGDTNGDGHVDIADAAWLARALTQGGEAPVCASAADVVDFGVADASGGPVDLADLMGLLDHLYTGSTTLPELASGACDTLDAASTEAPCGALALHIDAPRKVRDDHFSATILLDSTGLRPEGWSLSVTAEGCTIETASLDGTAGARAALDSAGQRKMGFGRAETVSGGAVAAVLLGWGSEVKLARDEDIALLKLELSASPPDRGCDPCTLRLSDGLIGGGQPVDNVVSVGGRRYAPELPEQKVKICAP